MHCSEAVACVCRTIYTGWRRTLTFDDIWTINEDDSSTNIMPAFERNWRRQKAKVTTKQTEKYM